MRFYLVVPNCIQLPLLLPESICARRYFIAVYLHFCVSFFAVLERKLLSHICENGDRLLFSSIPSSRLPPGVPDVSGDVREPPYRTDTDTPTFTGDYNRVQMVVRMTILPFVL